LIWKKQLVLAKLKYEELNKLSDAREETIAKNLGQQQSLELELTNAQNKVLHFLPLNFAARTFFGIIIYWWS
jgi:hypothetical protein